MKNRFIVKIGTTTLLTILMSICVYAEGDLVNKQTNEEGIMWISKIPGANYMLRISGPNGFTFEKIFNEKPPSIVSFGEDGLYRYEITALPSVSVEMKKSMRKAREENNEVAIRSFQKQFKRHKESGHFRIQGGVPVNSSMEEKRSIK